MEIDRLNDLPQEIIIDILSRLPFQTIMISKCICKSWRDLVKSPYFVWLHSHHAALTSARLPAFEDLKFSRAHSLLGFIGGNEIIQKPPKGSVLYTHTFPEPYKPFIHSSVNGLLFMIDFESMSKLFICNPITREYVTIKMGCDCYSYRYAFGFGVSKSGQYKLVRVYARRNFPLTCQVYNLGIGQWKSITIESELVFWYQKAYVPPLVNGNLHWLVIDHDNAFLYPRRVYCLDLETDLFKSFSCPRSITLQNLGEGLKYSLSALRGRLCFSNDADDNMMEIWCMKKYGDDKSWTKDYVIKRERYKLRLPEVLHNYTRYYVPYDLHKDILSNVERLDRILERHEMLYPVKAFKDGGILLALLESARLFYYSGTTKVIREIKKERNHASSNLVIHSLNFVSLKSLVMEKMRVKLL
ncbi:F-box protein At5g49610-like [Salvia splendens]|uniref:F-box protein At5g49610-like n=1 Tax=Salvia splendens TaxID=180675 RepID=UPI001C275234|nr:F-box protein At5g49610-like [Salvia splendens]